MCDNNIISILDVLLTETTLVTVESWTATVRRGVAKHLDVEKSDYAHARGKMDG